MILSLPGGQNRVDPFSGFVAIDLLNASVLELLVAASTDDSLVGGDDSAVLDLFNGALSRGAGGAGVLTNAALCTLANGTHAATPPSLARIVSRTAPSPTRTPFCRSVCGLRVST